MSYAVRQNATAVHNNYYVIRKNYRICATVLPRTTCAKQELSSMICHGAYLLPSGQIDISSTVQATPVSLPYKGDDLFVMSSVSLAQMRDVFDKTSSKLGLALTCSDIRDACQENLQRLAVNREEL